MEELIRKSDARKAVLANCPSIAYAIDRIQPVDARAVKHAHLIERTIDHECPSNTVFECSQCWTRADVWNKYCSFCGSVFDEENKYVRNADRSELFRSECNQTNETKSQVDGGSSEKEDAM